MENTSSSLPGVWSERVAKYNAVEQATSVDVVDVGALQENSAAT